MVYLGQVSYAYALGNNAVSPDGQRIMSGEYKLVGSTFFMMRIEDVWAFYPRLLDARSGVTVAINTNDPGNHMSPQGWSVRWPADSKMPWVDSAGLTAPMGDDGKLGDWHSMPGRPLRDGSCLAAATDDTRRIDARGRVQWQVDNDPGTMTTLDAVSPDESRFYRTTWNGAISCLSLSNGAVLWRAPAPCHALLKPVADGALAGTVEGTVVRFGLDGKAAWQACVRKLHEQPAGDYAAYIRAGLDRDIDSTGEFYPAGEDKPGDYDQILRLGMEQLANAGFEENGAWTVDGGAPAFADTPHQGKRSLRLQPGAPITQTVDRRVVPLGTYLLEFFYQPTGTGAVLTAGAQLRGDRDTFTLSTFHGRPGAWNFGRIAIKSMSATKGLSVGLEATGGTILVDDVTLKPVRFPSANLLAQPELHAIEPTFVRDFRVQYNRIPTELKQALIARNHVSAFKQGGTETALLCFEEEGFLQNGRIDDVGTSWYYPPDGIGFSAVLAKPAWISHLVLYLNNARPDMIYRTLAVEANNMETKNVEVVHVVRNNHRRFIVVNFPKPIFTDCIKILPGAQLRAHNDALTEIELYGPVGGPEMAGVKTFPADSLASPMLMGAPSHVPAQLPADLVGNYVEAQRVPQYAPAFFAGAITATNMLVYGGAGGTLHSVPIRPASTEERRKRAPEGALTWSIGTVAPITTPAWYAGRLLVGSADEKMHAVAENGTQLWSFQTEGRVYSAPTPAGGDVFFGSDDGRLYRADVDSGILLWEFKTGGKIRSSPALADGKLYVASWDGFLYAVTAEAGKQIWKAPIAPYTRTAPAVAGGRVYLGDESGHMRSFGAADGQAGFDLPLGGRISHGAVVTPQGVFFCSEQGHMAVVAPDGQTRWTRKLEAEITGQPCATQSQLLVPTAQGIQILKQADGQADDRIHSPAQPGRLIAALPYGDRLCLVVGGTSTSYGQGPVTYAGYYGHIVIWAPEEKP